MKTNSFALHRRKKSSARHSDLRVIPRLVEIPIEVKFWAINLMRDWDGFFNGTPPPNLAQQLAKCRPFVSAKGTLTRSF
ncbi:MAG: hypothetical protein EXS51_01185 [Candidatus Taylorbacteria bacterium]|nr:hypothetical protein [Candidatus Taylorbacteria bacterium]